MRLVCTVLVGDGSPCYLCLDGLLSDLFNCPSLYVWPATIVRLTMATLHAVLRRAAVCKLVFARSR